MMPIDTFHKGWSDPELFADFKQAVVKGDCFVINRTMAAQNAGRRPVDANINAMRMPNQLSGMLPPLTDGVLTEARRKELQLVHSFAHMRDEPIASMSGVLPEGMRELSWFLRDQMVPTYKPGEDFMTNAKNWRSVMEGDRKKAITKGKLKNIVTLRDAASYVHSDSPFELWGGVADTLMSLEINQRTQTKMNDHDGVGPARFTCFGSPFMHGIIGYAILMSGPLSFKNKWYGMVPRPEQLMKLWLDEYLPVAYPEGSPMHPARPAMHSFAALVCAFLLLELFDGLSILPSGRTVEAELLLLADNVGYFRVFAGVHYPSDHDDAIELARKAAETIVARFLR